MTVTTDDETIRVRFAPLDDARASTGGRRARYRIGDGPWETLTFAWDGSATYLALSCGTYAFRNVAHDPPVSAAASAGDGFLRAPMSGKIVAVHARAGQTAAAGSALVVLEAMKMEHVLSLPVDVSVRHVGVSEGAQANANDVLVEYDPIVERAEGKRR